MKKIGFVIPWYGENIPGGAETALRGICTHLYEAGMKIEILTTCVEQFASDWNVDFYPEGVEVIHGIPVRRFKVRKRDTAAFDRVNLKLMQQIAPSLQEERIFMEEMVNSLELYSYISENRAEYEWFVHIPYMFGTTYYGILACPEKAVVIPCFHDESYAYMSIFKQLFPQVKGMLFHSLMESRLANRIYDLAKVKQLVLGDGIDTNWTGEPAAFRKKFGINEPYILYAGRKDTGKQVDVLLEYFCEYKNNNTNTLKLVLIGGGNIHIPDGIVADVYDLGFVDIQDKYNAYAAAELLCQPSLMESFSIVIMESWLAERPVIVNKECAVTDNFVKETGGGYSFENYSSFESAVNDIIKNPEMARKMGRSGRRYVLDNFNWDVIVERLKRFFGELSGTE